MASDYPSYVIERYQGEVYGEVLFRALAEQVDEEGHRAKLRMLEQLERETKEFLHDEMLALGLDSAEDPRRRVEGEALAKRLAGVKWLDFIGGFRVEVDKLVAQFGASEKLAPPGKEHVVRHVTAHERALAAFAASELQGVPDSLAPVRALLRHPPGV